MTTNCETCQASVDTAAEAADLGWLIDLDGEAMCPACRSAMWGELVGWRDGADECVIVEAGEIRQ